MSVEIKNQIDFIIEEKDHKKGLLISDHLPWIDGENNHLYLLQEKINAYLGAVESGQLNHYYPSADKGYRIRLICKYAVNKEGETFLSQVKRFLLEQGYEFELSYFDIDIHL